MAIKDHRNRTAADTEAMVWDLVGAFALLSARVAHEIDGQAARPLAALLGRMGDRAAEVGDTDLANRLHTARRGFEDTLPSG